MICENKFTFVMRESPFCLQLKDNLRYLYSFSLFDEKSNV